MKGSLIIVGFFVLGTLCGAFQLIPFDVAETNISFYALCALMFSVGISIGNDPQTLKNFRSLNPRLVFLPVATILGTLSAAALVSLLLPHRSVTDCMAVGSGFGYYSLSSIFITQYKVECPLVGSLVWKSCSYIGWRCHHDGYNIAYYYSLFRTAVCCCFHFSWFCYRF